MPLPVTVPRLGWSMDEGTFAEWLKQDGDWVARGEMLFVLEGEKAVQEIESFDEGTLCLSGDAPQPGDTVRVGQVIGHLLAKGEPRVAPAATTPATPAATPAHDRTRPDRARTEIPASTAAHREHTSTPRARRVARELGVDWTQLAGTGADGRVRERDVLTAARAPSPGVASVRRTIAAKMLASLRQTAPVTLTTRADAANLLTLRTQFPAQRGSGSPPPTINDLIIKLTAATLRQHPRLNARWTDDGIVESPGIHIGLAVDTDDGLLVPVLRDADRLDLPQIAACTRDLIDRARSRRLAPAELRDGTFTVTNLSPFGIDAFTPIINAPEAAILGVGAIRREAVPLDDGRIVAAHVITLSLTFDHRIVDGAPAARFLRALVQHIEDPAALSA